ncbi:MAG: Molybdenum transport ATP-binding protein ModC, partial [uncultured Rubrobacteraceae bacterium]
ERPPRTGERLPPLRQRRARAGEAEPRRRAGGAGRPPRPLGVRQDDGAQGRRRPLAPDRRRRAGGRALGRRHPAREARGGDGLPEAPPLPPHGRHRKRRVRPENARRAQGGGREEGGRGPPARADGGLRRPFARGALRRPAAEGRARPRPRHRATAPAPRRALQRARRQPQGGDARPRPQAPARGRPHDRLRHARPGRGRRPRGPHRPHLRRPTPDVRLSRGLLRPPRHPRGRPLLRRHQLYRRPGERRLRPYPARRPQARGNRPSRRGHPHHPPRGRPPGGGRELLPRPGLFNLVPRDPGPLRAAGRGHDPARGTPPPRPARGGRRSDRPAAGHVAVGVGSKVL